MDSKLLSCSNYFCDGYKLNICERAKEHRLKLYEKRLDDNHIPKRSNSDICDMYIKVKDRL